jgi:hypothetical protein
VPGIRLRYLRSPPMTGELVAQGRPGVQVGLLWGIVRLLSHELVDEYEAATL